ncbi:MAG: serine hydrolase domain-containing protein [Acidimicrobiales bacterium]
MAVFLGWWHWWPAPAEEDVAVFRHQAIDGSPMTRRSLFRIASITKPIVAAATLALVERGLFELDEPVSACRPSGLAPGAALARRPGRHRAHLCA